MAEWAARWSDLRSPLLRLELVALAALAMLLIWGGVVYQLARAGHFARAHRLDRAAREEPESLYDRPASPLAILIPSYREEEAVLRQTILSAALMEYPDRRVTVLLDDPPHGAKAEMDALSRSRALVDELDALMAEAAEPYQDALAGFLRLKAAGAVDLAEQTRTVAGLYRKAGWWLRRLAQSADASEDPAFSHVDAFFDRQILLRPAADHFARAAALDREVLSLARLEHEHRRLASLFSVGIGSFERKRYANLSHAPNKAMNLNAYIGLIGRPLREARTPEGLALVADAAAGRPLAPAADYLLTLDADSLVLSDYALKLVAELEADPRLGVVQTPYSSFPGARRPLERIAGATTDLQYIVHQGFTAFRATYWVGANALLRLAALKDVEQRTVERGHEVSIFIQDRTVIEDTGSTIDLVRKGWRLHNHPQRLAYSATPPDFGSLIVQRGRWANGGLIILPDLIRYGFGGRGRRSLGLEFFMRAHYLLSPAVANLGLLLLLFAPFDSTLAPLALPLTAVGYYVLYARDLKQAGYRRRDIVGVYALNLILVPVNLAGVAASLRQLLTGRKCAFARTPKVGDRTAAPAPFVLFQLAMLAVMSATATFDAVKGHYLHAAFAAANAGLLAYGHTIFIGWRASWDDIRRALAGRSPAAGELPGMRPTFNPSPLVAASLQQREHSGAPIRREMAPVQAD